MGSTIYKPKQKVTIKKADSSLAKESCLLQYLVRFAKDKKDKWYFKPVQRYSAGSVSNPVYICERLPRKYKRR